MSLPVVLLPEAQQEFDQAFDWYEAQHPGLGMVFAEQVQELLDQIAVHPRRHHAVTGDVRRAVVRRLPYSVFYRVERSKLLVLAVFHAKRDPRIWQSRL
jgi:plasmid stabilization system protein ParE